MPISVTGKRLPLNHQTSTARGFTLLELMVVMVLIGLLSSALVLNLSSSKPPPLQQVRERLQRFSLQLYEQAVLRNRMLGLQITAAGEVRALEFNNSTRQWQPVVHNSHTQPLKNWQLPTAVRWQLDNSNLSTATADRPQVLFSPQGLVTPFRLNFYQTDSATRQVLKEQFDDRFFYPQEHNRSG